MAPVCEPNLSMKKCTSCGFHPSTTRYFTQLKLHRQQAPNSVGKVFMREQLCGHVDIQEVKFKDTEANQTCQENRMQHSVLISSGNFNMQLTKRRSAARIFHAQFRSGVCDQETSSQDCDKRSAQACAIEMHMVISQEPFYARILS